MTGFTKPASDAYTAFSYTPKCSFLLLIKRQISINLTEKFSLHLLLIFAPLDAKDLYLDFPHF
jgi:hypothetical protein